MRQDLRSALRMIRREPGFAAMVVATLAVGIGANTAIFSVVNSILLRPLPYSDSERLVSIYEVIPKAANIYPTLPVNLSHFYDWRKQSTTLESIALLRSSTMNLTGVGEPALLAGARVSANAFDLLGVRPELGRTFLEAEDRQGQDRVVILSHSLWTQRFQSNPSVVGRKIVLDASPYLVVGILPPAFAFPKVPGLGGMAVSEKAQIFKPIGYSDDDLRQRLGDLNWMAIARLRQGVTLQRALSELNVIQAGISKTLSEDLDLHASIAPLRDSVAGASRRGLLVIMSAVAAVLLVLCVNLANLWFARVAGRNREAAIRLALGASRRRLIQHTLTESLLLALFGGTLGVALAYAGLGVLLVFAPADLPRLSEVHLDGLALAFAVALSIVSGILFGILPALRISRQDPQDALKSGSHTNSESSRGVWVGKALVAAEVGLSTVLLIAAGLLIRSFDRLINIDRGFDVERVLAVDIALPSAKYTQPEQRSEFFRRVVEKAQAMPGVQSASIVSALPLEGEIWVDMIGTEHDARPMMQRLTANVRFISPDYFKTPGVPLRTGRTFNDSDRGRLVAIVSQSLVQRLWPGEENPPGRRISHNDKVVEVVGVTPDLRSTSLEKDPVNMVYIPFWQRSRFAAYLLVRTGIDPHTLMNALRSGVWQLDGDIPVPGMRTLSEIMHKSVGQRRFSMLLVAIFALSALALASFGVFGVLACSVMRRRNEIGIRMALGAGAAQVRGMVLRQGMQPVVFGLGAGLVASIAIGRVLSSLLFQVSAHDPLTMAAVVTVLSAVATAACILPAVRATRVNPIAALRCD
jgi:predicted permease